MADNPRQDLYLEISRNLVERELPDLRNYVSGAKILPAGVIQNANAHQIFNQLEKENKLKPGDLSLLTDLLRKIGRHDYAEQAEKIAENERTGDRSKQPAGAQKRKRTSASVWETVQDSKALESAGVGTSGTKEGTKRSRPDKTDELASAFTSALTIKYSNTLKTLKPLPWDDRFCLDLDKIFTHLVLIGHQGCEARRMFESLDDVFLNHHPESGQSKRFNVLVVGDAGSGKSTLLSKTALDWSCEKGRLADMKKIVLLIRLREVEPGESIAQIVWDQCITKSAKGISISSIETCLQDYESDVVFLLDGYDELVPDAKGPKQAVPELLAKTWYPDCTIIVTSRPSSGVSASRLHPREQLNFPHKSMQEFLAARYAADRVNNSDDLHSLVPLDTVSAVLQQKNLVQFICGCGGKAAGELLSSLNRLYVADDDDSNKTLKHLCLMSLYEGNDSQHFPILSTVLSSLDVHITIPCREGAALKYYLDHAKAMPEGRSLKLTLLEERDGDAVEYLSCLVEKTLSDALGQILPKLTMLEKLDLSHNSIGDKGKEPFAAIQQPVASPKVLDLSNTKLGDVCLRSLAAVLHHLSCLERLDLTHSNIGNEGLEPFAAIQLPVVSLKVLILSHNKIGDVCLRSLAAVLHHLSCLEKLYLSHNNIGIDGLEPFAAIQLPVVSLKVLILSHNKIGDVCLRSLAAVLHHLSCLEKLCLSHNNIGIDGLEPFAAIQQPVVSLKVLDLSHNKIGDVCLRSLAAVLHHLSCLEYLDLSHNNIGNEGLEPFAAIQQPIASLKVLDLSHNEIGDVCLRSLAAVLHHLSCLEELYLSHNNIGNEGLEPFAAIQQPVASLKVLNLFENKVGDVCLGSLVAVLHHLSCLERLDLPYNNIGNDGLEPFAAIQQPVASLKVLDLDHNKIGDVCLGSLAAVLHRLSCLKALALSHNNIRDVGFASFAATLHHAPTLECVTLDDNPVTAVGLQRFVETIPRMPALKELSLFPQQTAHLDDTAAMSICTILTRLPVLKHLYLRNISMQAAGFQAVATAVEEHPTLQLFR
ncbi:hypothetical protein Bbelb_089040 [Branchiostoma belcheri]|nr:hypothetical protein Bbelb_089040 [Branchiostoma belcheri]